MYLLDLKFEQMEDYLDSLKISKFHAKTIFYSIYKDLNLTFDFNLNLAKNKKEKGDNKLRNLMSQKDIDLIKGNSELTTLTQHTKNVANDGTTKFVFKTKDGHFIESVIIPHTKGKHTFCISSQIGCAMGCKFCVTGLHGLKRNLSAGEIVEQVIRLSKIIKPTAIVFMGQGEPINNYNSVRDAIMIFKSHEGFNFSAKKITVSTSGLIPGLIKLQKETGIKMAYSLNATTQNDRTRIMNVNKILDFEKGLALMKKYLFELNKDKTRPQKLMIEYVMFKGFNDKDDDLARLIGLCKDLKYVFVNLIPYNEHDFAYADFPLIKSEKARYFFENLMENDIQCFIRHEHGADIYAACGMLSNTQMN